jgi:hypothetical protein
MSSFPCLVRFVSASGQVRYRLGDRLADRYLEFVAGRSRVLRRSSRRGATVSGRMRALPDRSSGVS